MQLSNILSCLLVAPVGWVSTGCSDEKVFDPSSGRSVVEIRTSMGVIQAELFNELSPVSTKNFLGYVEKKHFDGTVFHRVMKDFMVQGGGFEPGADGVLEEKTAGDPIINESSNGLINLTGTLAMARTPDPNSATAQFYINAKDNDFLNRSGDSPDQAGYAVFGKVIAGMDTVRRIEAVQTTVRQSRSRGPDHNLLPASDMPDVPVEDVVIQSIRVLKN